MATTISIPPIRRSPALLQYKTPSTHPTKFYKTRFVVDRHDRAETLQAEWFRTTDPLMPPYPYGKDVRYSEANDGLYGGKTIQSGNKISKGRNEGKTLRKWYPNVRVERLQSKSLGKELVIPVAARVMRTIRKVGGLDEYVTGTKPARVKELGLLGWKLRWMVINSKKFKTQYLKDREILGLNPPPPPPSSLSSSLPTPAPTPQTKQTSNSSTISPPTTATATTLTTEEIIESDGKNPLDESFELAWSDADRRADLVDKQISKWDKLRAKDDRFRRHYLQTVIADREDMEIPELETLSLYGPRELVLEHAEVVEDLKTGYVDPGNDVGR